MSLNKIGGHSAIASSAEQPTTAQAAPHGPTKAATSPVLQSLGNASRAVVDAGVGVARRTAVLAMAVVGDMLVPGAEAGYNPALGGAAAVGAANPRSVSGDGSETAKKLGMVIGGVVGAAGVVYAGVKAYQHFAGKKTPEPAARAPVGAPAGSVNNV